MNSLSSSAALKDNALEEKATCPFTMDIEDHTLRKKTWKDIFLEEIESKAPLIENPEETRFARVFKSVQGGDYIKSISIPGYHISDLVVHYEIVVTNSRLRWNVWIRYDSFSFLHRLMQDIVRELKERENNALPPMPSKHLKLLTDHHSHEFVENRRALLENYLQKINSNGTLRYAEDFMHFLLPPKDVVPTARLGTRGNPHPKEWLDEEEEKEMKIDSEPARGYSVSANSEMIFLSEKDAINGLEIKSASFVDEGAHALYYVHVWNINKDNAADFEIWIVKRRFMEFVEFDKSLREALQKTHPNSVLHLPKLPPKLLKSWTDHKELVFIEKRRVLLQVYLRRLIRYPLFRRHPLTLAFLDVKTTNESRNRGGGIKVEL